MQNRTVFIVSLFLITAFMTIVIFVLLRVYTCFFFHLEAGLDI